MKVNTIFLFLSYIVISCGPSVEEEIKKYDELAKKEAEEHDRVLTELTHSFQKDSLEILTKGQNRILELADIFNALTNTTPKTIKKELILDATTKNKNILFYHNSIFELNSPRTINNFDSKTFDLITHFTQQGTYPFQADQTDINYSKENFNAFKQNCKTFVNAKYALIQSDLEVKAPQLQDSMFTEGYYKGHAALIDIDSKTVIDNFVFEAKSSTEIQNNKYYINGKSADESNISDEQALINDYFENIYLALDKEISERYTLNGALPKLIVNN
ncbi:MAG: hypothetical protein N4A35_16745 [Flavobacteriales bacterium]|jgi:hypothetical protein|nr:hypothetical protein [Flavobacteriales bacterium]